MFQLTKHTLLACSLFLFTASSAKATTSVPEWKRLVEEAYLTSRSLSPEERADLLLTLLETRAADDQKQREAWSLELFRITTQELKPSHYRAAMQKNALVDLCKADPWKAAELYTTQDTPDMWNQEVITEDYRAYGTRILFPALWTKGGMSSLPTIIKIANWIGDTGQYPYVEITPIIASVASVDKSSAESLASAAVKSFETHRGFINKHQEFVAFVLGIQNYVSIPLLKEAIEAELQALDEDSKDSDRAKFSIQAKSSKGTVQLNDQAEYVAYRLLPLINRIDADWADQIKQKYIALKYLPEAPNGQMQLTGAVSLPGQNASGAEMSSAMDEHRLLQVTMLALSNPQQAEEIALGIQDPGRQAIALATLAPGFTASDPKKSEEWVAGSTAELGKMPAGEPKLQLIVALAKDALYSQKNARAGELFNKSFDLGEELFEEDARSNPGKMAYTTVGDQELAMLVEVFAKSRNFRATTTGRVREVRNDVLRARLLVAAAKGVGEDKS